LEEGVQKLVIVLFFPPFEIEDFVQPGDEAIVSTLLKEFFRPTITKIVNKKSETRNNTTNLAASFRRCKRSFFTRSISSNELDVLSKITQNLLGDQAPLLDLSFDFDLEPSAPKDD
jgi:hypothetical protein